VRRKHRAPSSGPFDRRVESHRTELISAPTTLLGWRTLGEWIGGRSRSARSRIARYVMTSVRLPFRGIALANACEIR